MNRIKLPGKDNSKKILLIVLVIIAMGLLFYEYSNNAKNANIKNNDNDIQEQEVGKSIGKEDGSTKNIITKDEENNIVNQKKVDTDKEYKEINKEKISYSNKENVLYNEIYTLFFSGKYTDAISKASDLISEFPNNARGYNIRGIAKAYSGDYDGGMSDIDRSLEFDGDYGYARFNKALTYELYENMDEALKWYNKDLEIEDYVWSYYGISSIYGRRGDIENTMKHLNKAIQMDNGVKEVAKTEHDFDPVRNFEEFKEAVYN